MPQRKTEQTTQSRRALRTFFHAVSHPDQMQQKEESAPSNRKQVVHQAHYMRQNSRATASFNKMLNNRNQQKNYHDPGSHEACKLHTC
jgi:hypothetical protein